MGRRRFLLIGLVIFILASLVCALAPSIGWLIAARGVQGVGSAMIWPCIIGMATTVVDEKDRGVVMGLIIGATASGNVIGPVIAGVFSGLGDWRLFFFVNVAMALVSALLIWRILKTETAERIDERIDYGGMIVLSVAILALLYALDVGADWGWGSPPVIGLFVLFAVLLVVFPFIERMVKDPMVPPAMIHNKEFMLTLSTNGLIVPAFFLSFLYFPQYLHKVMGWSVLSSSFGMLPLMISIAGVSMIAGRFYNRLGPRRLLFTGYILTALGLVWVIVMAPAWGYIGIVPPMLLIGLGAGIAIGSGGCGCGQCGRCIARRAGRRSFVHVPLRIGRRGRRRRDGDHVRHQPTGAWSKSGTGGHYHVIRRSGDAQRWAPLLARQVRRFSAISAPPTATRF